MYLITFKVNPDTRQCLKVMSQVCSEAEYRELRNSEHNQSVLTNVRTMYDEYRRMVSEGASEPVLKQQKEAIDSAKSHLVQFNYSCIPNDDMLLKGCTKCSAWVGMDVDFDPADKDFNQKMSEAPQRIIAMKEQLGLGMLERSAGKGYLSALLACGMALAGQTAAQAVELQARGQRLAGFALGDASLVKKNQF